MIGERPVEYDAGDTFRSRAAAVGMIISAVLLYFFSAILLFPTFALASLIRLGKSLVVSTVGRTTP